MKNLFALALAVGTISLAQAQPIASSTWGQLVNTDGCERVAGMLVVDLVDQVNPKLVERDYGLTLEYVSLHSQQHKLLIARLQESVLPEMWSRLAADPRVTAVGPNYVCEALGQQGSEVADLGAQAGPNDPMYPAQWNMKMLNAETAWGKARGQGVRVAMVDTGLSYWKGEGTHQVEDLEQTTVLEGYDFVRDQTEAADEHGQGTHMAGTIAQSTNNGKGVVGLAFEAQLMAFKVLDRTGRGTMADVSAAIQLAADRKAQIIVTGVGSKKGNDVLLEAVRYAKARNCLLIGAAGVGGGKDIIYPAAYPEVLAISAVDQKGKLTDYTSRGPAIDLAAPGGKNRQGEYTGILQNTIRQGDARISGYYQWAGTSMSAAHVAGVAALIYSTGVSGADQVRDILQNTAQSKGAKGKKEGYGAGIVDAGKAVAKAQQAAQTQQTQGALPVGMFFALLAGFALTRRRR